MSNTPKTIRLADYRQPDYLIHETHLHFELYDDHALVHAHLLLERNPQLDSSQLPPLVLDGVNLELKHIALDDRVLDEGEYQVDAESLQLQPVKAEFTLDTTVRIEPQNNTELEGLYRSGGMFCTQCEAEGFRKITYYQDRPDVMSSFTTTLSADKQQYPVLLSNGNKIDEGEEGERHWATWEDPHKKPAYLFALVAGDLWCVEDSFTTMSGREVTLRMFVEPQNIDKCQHGMDSLKKSMRWDEKVYGREYDLDIFMIVAVDDFNMGAMENKGLNIFNSSCVLAKPETSTDAAFQRIESIVAHEYFHNWSGNRVTCRDWFQLSLKEGFTVFRDAEFSSDMNSRTVKRIEDVTFLRTHQFAEDAGPLAHPVRPPEYMEISNFYTWTIYEKGAEVVRMLHTLLGPELFRKGSDLYFERHDGQAVTCDDFVAAMGAVSGRDLTRFKLWYSQAGTPVLHVSDRYDAEKQEYRLQVRQSCPATPGQPEKEPFVIPLAMGLLDAATGEEIRLPLPAAIVVPSPDTTTLDPVIAAQDSAIAGPSLVIAGLDPAISSDCAAGQGDHPVKPGDDVVCDAGDDALCDVSNGVSDSAADNVMSSAGEDAPHNVVLEVTEAAQEFVFTGIANQPLPSLLRGFSAPVKLEYDYSREQLAFLLAHDTDGFNRWEAGQQLAIQVFSEALHQQQNGQPLEFDPQLAQALTKVLADDQLDEALKAEIISLPSLAYLLELQDIVDVANSHAVREALRLSLAQQLEQPLREIYLQLREQARNTEYRPEAGQIGRRRLQSMALSYLMLLEKTSSLSNQTSSLPGQTSSLPDLIRQSPDPVQSSEEITRSSRMMTEPAVIEQAGQYLAACIEQFEQADNMTERLAALSNLVNSNARGQAEQALAAFGEEFAGEPLVMDQWFSVQASSPVFSDAAQIRKLMEHPAFSIKNPNKVRAVLGAFSQHNLPQFHAADGSGYALLAEQVAALDALNPQMSARMVNPLTRWRRHSAPLGERMRKELEKLQALPKLSKDLYEVLDKALIDN